jgi:hypothetical protein
MDYFRERVPPKFAGTSFPEMMAQLQAHSEGIRAQQMPFTTLATTIIAMRSGRMAEQTSTCDWPMALRFVKDFLSEQPANQEPSDSNASNFEAFDEMVMTLIATLYEQIRGQSLLDEPSLYWDFARPDKLRAVIVLMSRLETELEAL